MGNKLVAEQKSNSNEEKYFRQDRLHRANIKIFAHPFFAIFKILYCCLDHLIHYAGSISDLQLPP